MIEAAPRVSRKLRLHEGLMLRITQRVWCVLFAVIYSRIVPFI